jgi:hypothetical protein
MRHERDDMTKEGILEEYKNLRQEIHQAQNTRIYVLGFTLALIGTLMQSSFSEEGFLEIISNWFLLDCFALVAIIAALYITISCTQDIERLATYIRTNIEGCVDGINWETRLLKIRQPKSKIHKVITRSLGGRSKYLASVYFLLSALIYVSILIRNSGMPAKFLIMPSGLLLWILFLTFSLYSKRFVMGFSSAEWKDDFDSRLTEE